MKVTILAGGLGTRLSEQTSVKPKPGISNINLVHLLDFHNQQQKLVRMTAVRPPARFGQMVIEDHRVIHNLERLWQEGRTPWKLWN